MKYTFIICLVFLCIESENKCIHPIFCSQEVLEKVAKSNYFEDSKEFVDLILKVSIQQALENFQKQSIPDWIDSSFTNASTILEPAQLSDFTQFPSEFSSITDKKLLDFAMDLNKRWKDLARTVNLQPSTSCTYNCSSFIPEMDKKTIIIPGGRFRQAYYWDSFWIVKGLIVCDLLQTAEKLLDNFFLLVEKYGFIPNGLRVYYLNRSQPPFLSLMVKALAQAYRKKGVKEKAEMLQKRAFATLNAEHKFWMSTHTTQYNLHSGKPITLNIYRASTTTPRPESYKPDMKLVQNVSDEQEKGIILEGVSSIAESGWDFSSRWLASPTDLKSNIIRNIIPSDLNTLMTLNEDYLATLSTKFQREDLRAYYYRLLLDRKAYFEERFTGSTFPDFNRDPENNQTYPTDLFPFMLFPTQHPETNLFKDLVNPVCSQVKNGMQWDYPNVWAPNNWILHEVSSEEERFKFAQQWVSTTYCSWRNTGLIYEKYRNDKLGERGEGGEYQVQSGFGWTNGLVLYYLSLYGDRLQAPEC